MLNKELMYAAHFARGLDMDANYQDLDGVEKATAWAHEFESHAIEARKQYLIGKEVLEVFKLSYSQRFIYGAALPEVAKRTVSWVKVDAGHIAYNRAQRLAEFSHREISCIDGNTDKDCIEEYIEEHLTDEDIEAWHQQCATLHVDVLLARFGDFAVYGSRTGSEPLTVNLV